MVHKDHSIKTRSVELIQLQLMTFMGHKRQLILFNIKLCFILLFMTEFF